MNQKKPYRGGEQPIYIYTLQVRHHGSPKTARTLEAGMEVTLERCFAHPAGRYRFKYAEINASGHLMLQFDGPTRRAKQRYRSLYAPLSERDENGIYRVLDIRRVHSKTRERDDQEAI